MPAAPRMGHVKLASVNKATLFGKYSSILIMCQAVWMRVGEWGLGYWREKQLLINTRPLHSLLSFSLQLTKLSSYLKIKVAFGLPRWFSSKESENTGDEGLIPGSGWSLGGGNGNPLQYSCLENPMNREAWWATVHKVAELDTIEWL